MTDVQVKEIDPLVIRKVPMEKLWRVNGKWTRTDKYDTLDGYWQEIDAGQYHNGTMAVTHIITLEDKDFAHFCNHLLDDQKWLFGLGGSDSDFDPGREVEFWDMTPQEIEQWRKQSYRLGVIVQKYNALSNGGCILVNPEGHNYARCVGIPVNIPEELGMIMNKDR